MTLLEDIKTILESQNITEYTDEQLEGFILEAQVLTHAQDHTSHTEKDVYNDFEGQTYVTQFYPIREGNTLQLRINDNIITPEYIDYNKGIIYLPQYYNGFLTCLYTTGYSEKEIQEDLLPLIVALARNHAGRNVSSISEGDVSVTYKGSSDGTDNTSIDALIQKFKDKYDAMIRWL